MAAHVTMVPFYPGDAVHRAGLEIVGIEQPGRNATSQIYEVRYACCGAVDTLSHRGVMRRIDRNSSRCPNCTPNSFRRQDMPFEHGPDWPAPERILADEERRFDSARCR